MQRHHAFATLVLLLIGGMPVVGREAVAQEWATKMFKETSHNFGSVARGAKVEYRFQVYNPYKETVHLVAVSSSCGCTTPEIVKSDLKTYERGEVVARFNTRSFTGNHAATLTLTIDRPYYATVQLNVWGDIRGDIEVQSADPSAESGVVDFGTVDQGDTRERKLTVVRYNQSDWQIKDVRSVNSNYEVVVADGPRSPGRVSYDLIVRLKKDAAPGYLNDPLILVTNDPQVPQFPIEVEGVVKAELNVRPEVLTLGKVEAGKQVTTPLIITGHKPFKIVSVHCDDDAFSFKNPSGAARVLIIPVTFTAPNKPGKLVKKIKIETDMGKLLTVEVVAQAEVIPAPAATTDISSPKTVGADSAKTPSPAGSATENIIKLDSGSGPATNGGATNTTGNAGASSNVAPNSVAPRSAAPSTGSASNATGNGDASSGTQIATPAVVKPASVMPNPIRSNAARSASGSSAAVN